METIAAESGYQSIAYLGNLIGGILGVATAAACLAAAIAFIRWMFFQQDGRGSGQQLATRWGHIAGALLAICIVYNVSATIYESMKNNELSQQIADEAGSGDKMWQPSNIDEVVNSMKVNGVSGTFNSPGAQESHVQAATKKAAEEAAATAKRAKKAAESLLGISEKANNKGDGKSSARTITKGIKYPCVICSTEYKSAAKAKNCAKADKKRLAKAQKKANTTAAKKARKVTLNGKTMYVCTHCNTEYTKKDLAVLCYDMNSN